MGLDRRHMLFICWDRYIYVPSWAHQLMALTDSHWCPHCWHYSNLWAFKMLQVCPYAGNNWIVIHSKGTMLPWYILFDLAQQVIFNLIVILHMCIYWHWHKNNNTLPPQPLGKLEKGASHLTCKGDCVAKETRGRKQDGCWFCVIYSNILLYCCVG